MRVAILSETLPPATNGQAVILSRLLQAFSPEEYCLLSTYDPDSSTGDGIGRLPGQYHRFAPDFQLTRGYRWGLLRLREMVNIALGILGRARQVSHIIKQEGCDAVVACTGEVVDLPAAYLASRRAGIPFYAYLFDYYSYREWWNPARKFWAYRLESMLLRAATGVVVPNEVLAEDLRRRYGVEATIIHNGLDIAPYGAAADEKFKQLHDIEIVYTGDIYDAHYDAFRNIVAAIRQLDRYDAKLHLFTPRTATELNAVGISGPVICHPTLAPSEIPRIQRQADVLFLPLAFRSPYPEVIRTSATAKLGEYLASRRPLLVHAPADAFVSRYVREHRCGFVVDRDDPVALAETMNAILSDESLQRELGERAWQRARIDFKLATAQEKFRALIERGAAHYSKRSRRPNTVTV